MRRNTREERLELRTLAEVAEMIGVHPGSIRRRLIEGRADAYRIGRDWLFTPGQVDELRATMVPRRRKD